jgi:hypothetical protein
MNLNFDLRKPALKISGMKRAAMEARSSIGKPS